MNSVLFSVIVPTYNRHDGLKRCLEAITATDFERPRFEVIVVNDGGSAVDDVVLQAQSAGLSVRAMSQPNSGPAAARNLGASAATGEYLAFLDDDCAPASNWFVELEKAVRKRPRSLIGGKTINVLSTNPFSQASQTLVDYVYQYYNDVSQNRARFFASNNVTADAAMFAEIGGFDSSFRAAEDRDFCRMWSEQGWDFHYVPDVIIHHCHHLGLRTLHKQHFAYGRGAFPYWRKAADARSTRLKVESFGFYAGMLTHPFSQRVPNATIIAILILFSQVSNAAGFAYEAGLAGFGNRSVGSRRSVK